MIINTVIVCLRDLLPIFIMYCYLSVFLRQVATPTKLLVKTMLFGLAGTFLLFVIAEPVSALFEGAGLELMHVSLLLMVYVLLVIGGLLISQNPRVKTKYLFLYCLGIGGFVAVKSTGFVIFFNVYVQQFDNWIPLAIGCLVGFGICVSFSLLFRFLLTELTSFRNKQFVLFCWYAFLAGQFSQVVSMLSQVDLLTVGQPIFNLEWLIQDSSEYGHILNALVGYESSPSKPYVVVYLLALITPFLLNLITDYFISKSTHGTPVNE